MSRPLSKRTLLLSSPSSNWILIFQDRVLLNVASLIKIYECKKKSEKKTRHMLFFVTSSWRRDEKFVLWKKFKLMPHGYCYSESQATLCAHLGAQATVKHSIKHTNMATEEEFKSHKLHYVLVDMNIPRNLTTSICINRFDLRVEIWLHNISLKLFYRGNKPPFRHEMLHQPAQTFRNLQQNSSGSWTKKAKEQKVVTSNLLSVSHCVALALNCSWLL